MNKEDSGDKHWQKIRVHILPKGFPEEKIQAYLGNIHGDYGEKDWPAYCKAAYQVSYCRNYNKTPEDLEREFGISPTIFALREGTYDMSRRYMDETGDTDPHYSQWYEALKPARNKLTEILNEDDRRRSLVFDAMKNGKFTNPHQSRKLKNIIGSIPALKRLCKDGMEAALEQSKNGKRPAESTMKKIEDVIKSIEAHEKSFNKRLKQKEENDRNLLFELTSKLHDILNATGNEDLIETAMQ